MDHSVEERESMSLEVGAERRRLSRWRRRSALRQVCRGKKDGVVAGLRSGGGTSRDRLKGSQRAGEDGEVDARRRWEEWMRRVVGPCAMQNIA